MPPRASCAYPRKAIRGRASEDSGGTAGLFAAAPGRLPAAALSCPRMRAAAEPRTEGTAGATPRQEVASPPLDVSVVMPAYNEAPNLLEVVPRVIRVLDAIPGTHEVLVV